jgi:hypothetical protein
MTYFNKNQFKINDNQHSPSKSANLIKKYKIMAKKNIIYGITSKI